jgi:hypothetical protein
MACSPPFYLYVTPLLLLSSCGTKLHEASLPKVADATVLERAVTVQDREAKEDRIQGTTRFASPISPLFSPLPPTTTAQEWG